MDTFSHHVLNILTRMNIIETFGGQTFETWQSIQKLELITYIKCVHFALIDTQPFN